MSASPHKEMRDTASSFADAPRESIKSGEDGPERSIALTGDDIASLNREAWDMERHCGRLFSHYARRSSPEAIVLLLSRRRSKPASLEGQ